MTAWMQELTLLMEAEFHFRRMIATLATIDRDGGPRARTVIVRWLDERDDSIWITADARSAKMEQLAACPLAELVFWTPDERQQFRVRGRMDVVREGPLRLDLWRALSDPARGMFFGPVPGTPRARGDRDGGVASADVDPPETFVLLGLRPVDVEALELNESPHRRRRWRLEREWQVELINP